MTIPAFNLHFTEGSRSFDIAFVEQKEISKESVVIDGRNYVLKGKEGDISWFKEKLPLLTNDRNTTKAELQDRLEAVGAENISLATRVHRFVRKVFPYPT